MKSTLKTLRRFILLLAIHLGGYSALQAAPVGTSIHYNGHLRENGQAANDTYDVIFQLWDASTGGNAASAPIAFTGVTVEDGVLTASPDFGDVFNGDAYWLELRVKRSNQQNYHTLTPRQSLSATAYALHAPKAGTAAKANGVNNGAVHTDGLQNQAVTSGKMAMQAVGKDHLQSDAVEQDKIKNGAVARDKLALKAVGHDQLDDDTISEIKLRDAAVGGSKLQAGAVTGGKIAAGQVVRSLNGLSDGITLAAGTGITITPSAGNTLTLAAPPGPGTWGLTGNSGVAATQFLGTTDPSLLTLKVNNVVVMRYEPRAPTANVVGGAASNNSGAAGAAGITIAGGGESVPVGRENLATDNFATVGGGSANQAGDNDGDAGNAPYSTVAGGFANRAMADSATVTGGRENLAAGLRSVISGGANNEAWGEHAALGGGTANQIDADAAGATIGGGSLNWARDGASHAVIPGGSSNVVDGFASLAAGYRANAIHRGAFVWADNTEKDFASTAPDEFSARALGGVRFVSGFTGAGGNTPVGVRLAPGSGSWSSLSDRTAKTNVQPVNTRSVLERLARLPMSTWSYRAQDAGVRHIGPMAQDFAAAFQVGEDGRHISSVDADGVALAAIQGLNEKLEARMREQEEEITKLRRAISQLKKMLDEAPAPAKGGNP